MSQKQKINFQFQEQNKFSNLFQLIRQFKLNFISRVSKQIQDEYEVYNIWSQFVIRYLQYPHYCALFSKKIQISADYSLKVHLTKKGFDLNTDSQFLQDLEVENSRIFEESQQIIQKILLPEDKYIEEMKIIICYDDTDYSFDIEVYQILDKIFDYKQQQQTDIKQVDVKEIIQDSNIYQENITKDLMIKQEVNYQVYQHQNIRDNQQNEKIQKIFIALFWYDFIGIDNGQQWSLNQEVFNLLKDKLNINLEIFASPFNHNLDNYFSLLEIDKYFGSQGNFNYNYLNIKQNFQANPPFIDCTFTQYSVQILQILEQNTQEQREIGCVIIFPWSDNQGYFSLQQSHFFIDEIQLLSNAHYYYDSYNNISIKSKFNTNILILGNNIFKLRYESYPYLSDTIVEAFQKKLKK